MSDTDTRLMHTVDREIQIEVPKEVLTEVALRTPEDATRTDIRELLHEHISTEHDFRGPDGSSAVDAILSG